jgi:uncharacterized protein DUF6232
MELMGKMAELKETTILQEGPVKITSRRTIVGTITYQMAQIKSVHVTRRGKNMKPLLGILPGLFFITWSLLDQTSQFMEFFNIGIAFIVVSLTLVWLAKPTYAVEIGNSSGDDSILRSTDRSFIQRIVDAMNTVIARRG